MKLTLSPYIFAVCRLEANSEIPSWSIRGSFFSLSKSEDELSLVCEQVHVPSSIKSERDWRLFKVEGPLDFSLTGVLASIADPLARAKVSIFAISTFDTDYILIRDSALETAIEKLKSAGFSIVR
jgi:uncharacterized protein